MTIQQILFCFFLAHTHALRIAPPVPDADFSFQSKDSIRAIPNRLVFNYKVNLLEDTSALPSHTKNVKKIMEMYPDMKTEFLDDAGCRDAIKAVHSEELAEHFSKEKFGPYKSDLCRLAQLAEKGGYYMDTDLEPVSDLRKIIPSQAAFVTVKTSLPNAGFFQAFLGSAPKHPIIMKALNSTAATYKSGERAQKKPIEMKVQHQEQLSAAGMMKQRRWLGPHKMQEAFEWWTNGNLKAGLHQKADSPGRLEHSYILTESNGPTQYGVAAQQGKGCCCNWVVADDASRKALFYSRFVGASEYCDSLNATRHSAGAPRGEWLQKSISSLQDKAASFAGSSYSHDLALWGGGWRALSTLSNSNSRTSEELSKIAFGALQQKLRTSKEIATSVSAVGFNSSTASAAPTDPLPSWAKWCLVRPCDGKKMFYMAVYATHDIVSQEICRSGSWEICDAQKVTGQTAGKGHVAVDIGGNIGYYTMLLANAGFNVVTIEPLPMNTQLIEATLKQNPALQSRVNLHKVGLSPHSGGQCLVYSDDANIGDGHTHCGNQAEMDAFAAKSIPSGYTLRGKFMTTTLDDLMEKEPLLKAGGNIDFLKMDVEGFEGEVMKGASRLLSNQKPTRIRSEVWSNILHTTPKDFLTSFAKAGYGIASTNSEQWVCENPTDEESLQRLLHSVFGEPGAEEEEADKIAKAQTIADFQMCLVPA